MESDETPEADRLAMTHEPLCGKCGRPMTPQDSRIHPEWFLHDACLPDAPASPTPTSEVGRGRLTKELPDAGRWLNDWLWKTDYRDVYDGPIIPEIKRLMVRACEAFAAVPASEVARLQAEVETLRKLMDDWHPKIQSDEQPTGNELIDRLRGIYVMPVNDGAGLLDGKDTFTRYFAVGALNRKAADWIEAATRTADELREQNERLKAELQEHRRMYGPVKLYEAMQRYSAIDFASWLNGSSYKLWGYVLNGTPERELDSVGRDGNWTQADTDELKRLSEECYGWWTDEGKFVRLDVWQEMYGKHVAAATAAGGEG